MEVPDQNLGNGLGVLGGRPKPSSDGFVFVAGDFLGGTEAPPAHHNEQRASHFGGEFAADTSAFRMWGRKSGDIGGKPSEGGRLCFRCGRRERPHREGRLGYLARVSEPSFTSARNYTTNHYL